MNSHKVSFIICSNNLTYTNECVNYLNRLAIPEGFISEILTIHDAKSMLSGYREGCENTDSLYKIFMHQDVFILNKNFIYDILSIFNNDPDIGLIGMVGVEKIPSSFIMWSTSMLGSIYSTGHKTDYSAYEYNPVSDGYDYAEAVDGFLIAVKGNPVLRDDIFDGWDFYDISMSLEAKKIGKRIAVPRQRMPWCMHDDGNLLSMLDYNKYRLKAIQEYLDSSPPF